MITVFSEHIDSSGGNTLKQSTMVSAEGYVGCWQKRSGGG
jgi:hypothetical protein